MVTFDTQKLFIGYQLEQLDAEAAAAALNELMARKRSGEKADVAKPTTLEQVDKYTDEERGSSDDSDGHPDDLDSDDSDYGLPGAVSNLALARKARPGSASSGGSGAGGGSCIAAVQPPKPKAVQGPVRVRPWPAGPLPSERADKGDEGSKEAKQKDKLQRQASLAALLGELKIKSSRLHNAGEGGLGGCGCLGAGCVGGGGLAWLLRAWLDHLLLTASATHPPTLPLLRQ
jgi:hypothetical protein